MKPLAMLLCSQPHTLPGLHRRNRGSDPSLHFLLNLQKTLCERSRTAGQAYYVSGPHLVIIRTLPVVPSTAFLIWPPNYSGTSAKWLLRTITLVIYMTTSSHQFIGSCSAGWIVHIWRTLSPLAACANISAFKNQLYKKIRQSAEEIIHGVRKQMHVDVYLPCPEKKKEKKKGKIRGE